VAVVGRLEQNIGKRQHKMRNNTQKIKNTEYTIQRPKIQNKKLKNNI
jgi:hypothetical protein